MGRTAKKEVKTYKPVKPAKNNNTVSMESLNKAFEGAEPVSGVQDATPAANVQAVPVTSAAPAAPAVQTVAVGEGEQMLMRPQKETNDKRVALNMPSSLYVKLYNGSVKANMSLNAFMLQIFREYIDR